MSDPVDLASWQTPEYPRGVRFIQFENEVALETTSVGWRMHNRTVNAARNAILFGVVVVGVAVAGGFITANVLSSVAAGKVWYWTAILAGWIWACGVAGIAVQRWMTKGRPAMLAVELPGNKVVESTNSEIVGDQLRVVVLRVGRKTDPENRGGQPIVQVAAVVERNGARRVEPIWTFDRSGFLRRSRSIEARLRMLAASYGFEVVVVEGAPAMVAAGAV